jgi:glycosyltransferase involved in cell wall biosynthesis
LRRYLFDAPMRLVRKLLSDMPRAAWHILPFSSRSKVRFKHALFVRFAFLFGWSQAYRSWYGMNAPDIEIVVGGASSALPAVLENQPDSDHYVSLHRGLAPDNLPVRLIAFYLPQFHAIKENNEWWGEGFTEWTNVKPARQEFVGHHQPHVPDELGYYNLLDRDVQRRQIELAKLYGVGGFCFYYYWFGGKRLLEQPIENYLADASLDHPFCLCWANENWSRRWDGLDSQILIAQQHSPEDDLEFAADVARYLRDPRYIRIDGKPLLVVYRPSLLPSALDTSKRWRDWFRQEGIGEIYLAYTQSFEAEDPRKYGFDAAIEFPPNNSAPPNITSEVVPLNSSFGGTVYDWSVFPERSRNYKKSDYRLFRSVCPSWDNSARRKNRGTVFLNSTPEAYQEWLENAVADTCQNTPSPDERLVFVNAWNEWAEGAHLEPDQKYGYAWLDATRKALTGEVAGQHRERIVIVSHDAHPHGAQFLALGMVRTLANDLKFEVYTVLLGDGRLKAQFAQYSSVHELLPGADLETRATQLARQLVDSGIRHAIVNTTVSGFFARALAEQGITCVSLVHEMPGVIQSNNLEEHARSIAASAHRVVFPAQIVKDGFECFATVHQDQCALRPQGLWRRNLCRFRKEQVRAEVRSRLGVAHNAPLILAVGYADRRKGVDLFVRAALTVLTHKPDALFVWIGHWDEELRREVDTLIKDRTEAFRFLGYEPDTAGYHAAADVYALASREDPFPNVVLESFDAGVPVVAFAETGGGAQLASRVGGRVVPAENTQAFAQAILELLDQPDLAHELGAQASALVDREYAFRSYLFDLCGYAGIHLPKISVVVPNYNYARHIRQRLETIVQQTLPIYELIILDDASTDDSVEVISEWLAENNVECRLVINECNSGCVFDQWAKGVALASGDFVWIAEADDLSLPEFLETVLAPMERDPQVVLSYCESQQINERRQSLTVNYQDYLAVICGDRWKVPYIANGKDEIVNCLAIMNTIPNVSGVLFKRERLASTFALHLDAIRSLGKAGDWLTYVKTLQDGKIAFSPRPLNLHCRHSGSVIGGSSAAGLVDEIASVQRSVACDYPLPGDVIVRATAYIKQLEKHFNLGKRVSNGSERKC